MRILHVIESLEFGGAEKVVIDLANAQSRNNEVAICCVKRLGDLRNEVVDGVQVFCLNKAEGNDPLIAVRIARWVRAHHVEVLHTHNWGVFLEGALARLLAPRVMAINTVHGPYMDYPPGLVARTKRGLRHLAERVLAPAYARVIVVSAAIAHYIETDIGIAPHRLATLHNGIDTNAPARRECADRVVQFIAVGRLAAIKNHRLLLEAFARVVDVHPNARLTLVGDGPERAELESRADERGIASRVWFAGFRHDIADQLARADVFVVSSDYEGVSIAVLEAMRAGLPVVGTDVGGMSETVESGVTGLLVPARDTAALANAMAKLAGDQNCRERMGALARRRLVEHFSIDAMLRQYERHYRKQA